MRLLLFLDDWLLDSRDDVVRRFLQPSEVPLPRPGRLGVSTLIWDPDLRRFRAWTSARGSTRARLYESTDGVHWINTRKGYNHYAKQSFSEGLWFHDPWDEDPSRRHKMIVWPYKQVTYGGPGLIATSPDGVRWTPRPEYAWSPPDGNGSDTNNNIFYNPFSKEYCVICRRWHVDRRISMVTSKDLTHWTPGRVLIRPDALDPPLLQFYGMKATLYEDEYFLGLVQAYHVPSKLLSTEYETPRVQMYGHVEPQLAYSYDGESWTRGDRSAFIPRGEPGRYGGGSIYPRALIKAPDDTLHVYSYATFCNHGGPLKQPKGRPRPKGVLQLHKLRLDGFACLEPVGAWGQVTTRVLVPRKPELTVNYQAPTGEVRVQIADEQGQPIPGFTFEENAPLCGDETHAKVRWKRRSSLRSLLGQAIRLQFRLYDARLFAVRMDCGLWYVKTKEPIERP